MNTTDATESESAGRRPAGNEAGSTGSTKHSGGLAGREASLLSTIQGFLPASVLFGLARLGIFALLREGPGDLKTLADGTGASTEHLARILNAGVAVGFLQKSEADAYRIAPGYFDLLADPAAPGYVGDWLHFMHSWYEGLADLDRAVREGGLRDIYAADAKAIREHTLAMHDFASSRGREMLDLIDGSAAASILDIGCGSGTYSFELASRYPHLSITLMDTSLVLDVAREVERRYSLEKPVTYIAGDIGVDPLGGPYDLVLISNTLHALPRETVPPLLSRIHESLSPGGTVFIQAQFLNEDHMGPRWAVFVDLAALCLTNGGRNHSVAETAAWLRDAGFSDIEHRTLSYLNPNGVVRAIRH
jgi:SAM-dependent methyltransferase